MPRCGGLSSKCSLSTSQHQFKYPNIRVCRISTPWLALFWGPVFDPSFFFQTLNFGIIFVSSKCNSEDVERSYSVGPFLIGVQKRYQKKTFSKHIFFSFFIFERDGGHHIFLESDSRLVPALAVKGPLRTPLAQKKNSSS